MKTAIISLLIVSSLSLKTTCMNSHVTERKAYITKDVRIESFNKIVVKGNQTVVFTQVDNGNPRAEIYAPENIAPLILVEVKDNTLTVRMKEKMNIANAEKMQVRIFAPAPKEIQLSGSGDIVLSNGLRSPSIALNINGSGDIRGKKIACETVSFHINGSGDVRLSDVEAQHLSASVNGSGDIHLSGKCAVADYRVNGSGDINAEKLVSDKVTVAIKGVGDIACHATTTLTGRVNGNGDVKYKGNPEVHFEGKTSNLRRF